jgi:tRNA U34 5-methylaminomethyl-2-thiouridine-forming methyltransferase MnmC
MIPFKTDDGSISYRKSYEAEPFHTKAGAIVEAFEKHSRALRIFEKENPVIFDVCSGIGYNSAAAIEELRLKENISEITIYMFENDLDILKEILKLDDELEYINSEGKTSILKSFFHIKNSTRQFLEDNNNIYVSKKDNLKIILIFGNFEETIDYIEEDADFIFYAPFSPKITPEMWTEDKFKKLFNHLKMGGKLSTYAYARPVRDAMKNSGFKLEDGPIIGRRSPSLIGIKTNS